MLRSLIQTLRNHPFQAHSLTFAAMTLASALGYAAVNSGAHVWLWFSLGLFGAANLIELTIK
ncbi:MAG: hypothetical protein IT297_04445 [Anaerolineae bacterium]|jgi:hypothetical protein|nr:hypothetical protein [Anaerolineae bacterium]MCZ7553569.1 hypothetical protein [Anaerolineales bacterium]